MRAGKLDNVIDIVRLEWIDDGMGNLTEQEVSAYTLRAQIIQASTEEFVRSWGVSDETVIIFRTRWADDIVLADKVRHEGRDYQLKEIKPIGRRRGLELRCVRI